MQVNLLSVLPGGLKAERAAGVLLSVLQGLGQVRPGAQKQAAQDEQLERKAERDHAHKVAMLAAFAPNSPAAIVQAAERELDPSSRAFRRMDGRQQAEQRFRQEQSEFRQALQEFRQQRSSESQSQAKSPPPTTNEGETGTSAESGKPASAAPKAATSSSAPAAARTTPSLTPATNGPTPQAMNPAAAVRDLAGVAQGPAAAIAAPTPATTAAPAGSSSISNAAAITAAAPVAPTTSAGGAGTQTGNANTQEATAPLGEVRPAAQTRAADASTKADADAQTDENDRQANIDRIVRALRGQIGRERSTTIIRLDPPELGKMRLELDLRNEQLELRVETATHAAHRLLKEDLDKLRHGLEAAGIHLERVEIRPPTETTPGHTPQHTDAETQRSPTEGWPGGTSGGSSDANAEHSSGGAAESSTLAGGDWLSGPTGSATESRLNVLA